MRLHLNDIQSIEVDYEILNYLRNNISLGIMDIFKVCREREKAKDLTLLYKKYEKNADIGIDYSNAEKLEYYLRLKQYQKKNFKLWKKYNNGETLEAFCYRCLHEEMEYDLNNNLNNVR